MTKSKQPKAETKESGALPDAALNETAGGMLACAPVDPTAGAHGAGGGGGAGKPAMGDGSVKTNNALIGLL